LWHPFGDVREGGCREAGGKLERGRRATGGKIRGGWREELTAKIPRAGEGNGMEGKEKGQKKFPGIEGGYKSRTQISEEKNTVAPVLQAPKAL
jgi:hypothetical protein